MKTIRFILISVLFAVVSIGVLVCAKKKNPAKWDNPQDNTGANWHPPTVVMMEGGAVPYRDTLYVTASATDSNGTILDYCWDINGNGYYDTTITGTLDVYLPDTGWYTIRVKARDNDKLLSQPDSVLLYATFHPPVVQGMPDFAVSIYDTFTLTAAGTDSNGVITKYLWALDGVNYTEESMAGSLRTVFSSEGIKSVKVRAVDDDGLQSLPDEINVTVRLDAPEVTAMNDISVSIYDTISITATSSDPNGSVISYHWAFDGLHFVDSTDTGFVQHVFDSAGVYDVKVKVKDDDGIFSDDDAVRITVNTDAPTVMAMDDFTISVFDTVMLTAAGTDANGAVVRYLWALDGANYFDTTRAGTLKTVFNTDGTRTVRVLAVDDDGLMSAADEILVAVELNAPTVVAMDDTVLTVNVDETLRATGSDVNGRVVKYYWALDGVTFADSTDSGRIVHRFNSVSVYTVKVKVCDDDGIMSAEKAVHYDVKNANPSLSSPADGYILPNYFGQISFKWQVGSYAQSFTLRMGKANPPTEVLVHDTTSEMYVANGIIDDVNATYYWLVVAKNAAGDSVVSPVFSFVINNGTHVMKYIAGGTFLMGCPGGTDTCDYIELPQHTVTVSPFYMDSTEVTQLDYRNMTGITMGAHAGDDLPVESINYFDMIYYCNRRSIYNGLDTVYTYSNPSSDIPGNNAEFVDVTCDLNKRGFRLPTEAEWEYACRGGAATFFFFGDHADSADLGNYAWCYLDGLDMTQPVAQKLPNPFGIYDILGNVFERCNDIFYPGYYEVSPVVDPPGPAETYGSRRMVRGGSYKYYYTPGYFASHYRPYGGLDENVKKLDTGFRCVLPDR